LPRLSSSPIWLQLHDHHGAPPNFVRHVPAPAIRHSIESK
jgi:hypothetical protein